MPLLVSELVDEVNDTLHSYVRDQDQVTSLATPMAADDLSIVVDDANQLSRGLVQIEDEMVYVKTVDAASGLVLLEPWGRGQSGSTAAEHAAGVKVTNSPIYPRQRVKDVVAGVIHEIFPDVFAVATSYVTPIPATTHYELDADTHAVISVENQALGPSGEWFPVRRWRQNRTASAVELEILHSVYPGDQRVRVTTMRTAPLFLEFSTDLEEYGYTAAIRDLVILGATSRLMAYTEPSRVQVTAVESHGRSASVPAGSAISISRYLYGIFKQRVEDERRQLLQRYPIAAHSTR